MGKSPTKRPRGRPSLYTPELAQEIADRLSQGEPLAHICRDDHMPCDDTVRSWEKVDAEFYQTIARARRAGFDAIAWRARQTLRGLGDSTGDVQRDKAIAEFDLKLLAKWDPRYADRQQHEISGQLEVQDHRIIEVRDLRPEQREFLRQVVATAIEGPAEGVTDAEFSDVD